MGKHKILTGIERKKKDQKAFQAKEGKVPGNERIAVCAMLSNRTFCSDGTILQSVLSNTVATSLMWLPNTRNVASLTQEKKCCVFIYFQLI